MSNKNKNLFEICKKLLDQYNENLSPAYYLKNVNESQDLNEDEKKFICEIFFGVCDKIKVLSVIVDGYYAKEGRNSLKNEKNYYKSIKLLKNYPTSLYHILFIRLKVLTYIGVYRTKTYGLDEFKIMTHVWNQEKILKFLLYFFNEKNLVTWIKDAWSSKYDHEYVDQELINPLLDLLPEMDVFLKDLDYKIHNPEPFKHIPPTEPEPFNFHQTLVRKILLPEKLETQKPRIRYDLATFKTESEPDDFQLNEKLENKTVIKTRGLKPKTLKKNQEQKNEPIERPQTFKAIPFKIPPNVAPVKINTAVVLREEAVIKKQTQDVMKNFEYLENGDRNSSEFQKWQQDMKTNDLKQQIEQLEKLKLQSKISYEKAKYAREEITKMNKAKAIEHNQKNEEYIKKLMEEKQEEDNKRKQTVLMIKENEKNIKSIKEDLIDAKNQIAKEVAKESEYLQRIALKEAEEEMKNKIELIQQIKAAESITIDRTKMVDLTSNAGHSLLSEMSIAELKERLEIAKQTNERNKKQIHDEIIKNKVQRGQMLVEKLHYINRYRTDSIQEKKNKNLSIDDLQKIIKQEMLEKNSELVNLKKKLEETKADSKANRNYKIEIKKTNQENIYSNQRKIIELEKMKNLEKLKDTILPVN